jgi:hypothetical protein
MDKTKLLLLKSHLKKIDGYLFLADQMLDELLEANR